ncbi:MAG: hypothetical protein WCL14_08730 [Bacteroidota bacterium]
MGSFKSKMRGFSWFDYFKLLTGIACIVISLQKLYNHEPFWKIITVFIIGLVIIFITIKTKSK